MRWVLPWDPEDGCDHGHRTEPTTEPTRQPAEPKPQPAEPMTEPVQRALAEQDIGDALRRVAIAVGLRGGRGGGRPRDFSADVHQVPG